MDIEDWQSWEMLDACKDYLNNHKVKELFDIMEESVYMKAYEIYEKEKKPEEIDIQDIIDYCMSHIIPNDCDRHNKLFKNITVFLVNNDFNDQHIKEIDYVITENCPGRRRGELYGWSRWAREKKREINIKELEDVAKLACSRRRAS